MGSWRLAILGFSIIAAAVALTVAGVDRFDTGTAQQPATVDSRFVPPRLIVAADSTARPSADGPAGRDLRPDVEMPDLVRTSDARRAALQSIAALAETPGQLEDAALAGAALSHVEPAVREEAVHALGERGGIIALQTLQQALLDPSPSVRDAAFRAFIDMGGDAAVLALGSALGAEDALTRLNAVDALGEIGGPDAARYLESMLQDENDIVRQAAAQWLAELSGGATQKR